MNDNIIDAYRMKLILTEIANFEHLPLGEFDMESATFYNTTGMDMVGNNVDYFTLENYSCWVMDCNYSICEIPELTNDIETYYGTFLFLAYNTDFDYYIMGYLRVRQTDDNKVKSVMYKNMGMYHETSASNKAKIDLIKSENGNEFTPGVRPIDLDFDVKMKNRIASYNSK